MMIRLSFAASIVALTLAGSAQAQQSPPAAQAETNPQSAASTTVKAPAGVSSPAALGADTQGMKGAVTGCKSASAEMTNGAVETCKQ